MFFCYTVHSDNDIIGFETFITTDIEYKSATIRPHNNMTTRTAKYTWILLSNVHRFTNFSHKDIVGNNNSS